MIERSAKKIGEYRYQLSRIWDGTKDKILFIGLNPSKADDNRDDNTVSHLINILHNGRREWEKIGGFYMGNLYSYIYADSTKLDNKPLGNNIENNRHLCEMNTKCNKIIFIWGNKGEELNNKLKNNRTKEIMRMFPNADCLGTTKNGNPMHPRRIKTSTASLKRYTNSKGECIEDRKK
jgi:hypothetical protein